MSSGEGDAPRTEPEEDEGSFEPGAPTPEAATGADRSATAEAIAAPEAVSELNFDEPEVFARSRGLPPPVAPKVPSLDDPSNDLDVPSELPATAPSALIHARSLFEDKHSLGDALSLEAVRKLMAGRRLQTALRQLPTNPTRSPEASLLRLRCLVHLRKYKEAEEEALGLPENFEAELLGAQLPWLRRYERRPSLPVSTGATDAQREEREERENQIQSGKYQTMLRLQALARRPCPEPELMLQLLQVLSNVSLAAGHGRIGAEEIHRSLTDEAGVDKRQLWSLLGRHHLAWGNRGAALDAFAKARDLPGEATTVLLNDGLAAMSSGDFPAARDAFEAAANAASSGDSAMACEEVLAAENNLAVCRFYTKDLRGARERLEVLVKKDPVKFLKPCLLQNLASLYEFSQDPALLKKKLWDAATAAQLEDLEPL